MTSAVERLSATFKDNSALTALCQDIATDIQSGNTKLHTFVEELGPFVTDKDVSVRERGIAALSSVLAQIPDDILNEKELHFITTFYCDRLKDHHSIIPAVLHGMLAIVQMRHLPENAPTRLLTIMFEHVRCQSQLLPDRRNIYLIFSTMLQKRINELKLIGPDFVYGVICAIDGERDPRNLMLLFGMLPQFFKEFPLGHLTEEMFEVIACYFPVDFNPTMSEGTNVTREDLAEALAPCLCAVPEFAEFCIPLISDKLMSSLRVAKLDSLNLLRRGAYTFGVKYLEQYLSELWSVIRKEIVPGGDAEVTEAALKAVATIVDAISEDQKVREEFVSRIISDVNSSLCDVQLSLFRPAEKLMETVAKVNKQACVQVMRTVVPLCLGQYSTKTLPADKVILMETLNAFVKICSGYGFCVKDVPELAWTDIPQMYLNELDSPTNELKDKAIIGLTIQKAYLTETQRATLYDGICREIESGCDGTRNTCHASLLAFATIYPEEILTFVKERLRLDKDKVSEDTLTRRLEALSAIAKVYELGAEVVPKIATEAITDSKIQLTALKCLHRLVTTRNIDFDIQHFLHHKCNLIDEFVKKNIDDHDKLYLVSSICRSVVRSLSVEEQQVIVNKYLAVLERMSEADAVLLENIFIPLRRQVDFKVNERLLESLYDLSINGSDLNTMQTSCVLLSVVLNKMNDVASHERIITFLKRKVDNNLRSVIDIDAKHATIRLLVWLTKAVVTKGSANCQDFLDFLCDMLKDDRLGQYTAEEYKTLVSKHEDALTTENYCNVTILYKQRVFHHLVKRNGSFDGSSRQNYLVALTNLLEEVPIELVFMYLTELVPLLIDSLFLDNGRLVLSALTTLKLLLDTKNDIFADKLQTFIPRLLDLSSYKTMDVRIAALECLTSYCNYSTVLLIAYQQDVLDKLLPALDDKKRLVRRAAVKARTRWFLIGAPGGVKD